MVEDVSQLPGLGEETSVEEMTKDLVKGFTILQKNDSIHMYIKHNITYVVIKLVFIGKLPVSHPLFHMEKKKILLPYSDP